MGCFLYAETRLMAGSDIELVLILSPELNREGKCWVCCQACVLRAEEATGTMIGVAATILRMDMLPEIPA
jgi:hypothetical protein